MTREAGRKRRTDSTLLRGRMSGNGQNFTQTDEKTRVKLSMLIQGHKNKCTLPNILQEAVIQATVVQLRVLNEDS